MNAARRAGWSCLAWGILFLPLAIVLHRLMGIPALAMVSAYLAFLFWACVVMTVISFMYAAWGLICGYSLKAWQSYERSQAEADRQNAVNECQRRGIAPPHYLNQSIPGRRSERTGNYSTAKGNKRP